MARQQKPEIAEIPATESPGKSSFERVAGWLDGQDWHYDVRDENRTIAFGMGSREVSYRVFLDIGETDTWKRLLVASTYPVRIVPAKRPALLEAINRINYALNYGNFEMDMDDGEIRCRTSGESAGCLDDAVIERAIGGNLALMEHWFAPLMAIAYGDTSPGKVLDLVRQDPEETLQ